MHLLGQRLVGHQVGRSDRRAPNRRIDTRAPSRASGGMMALMRLPSGKPAVHHRAGFVDAPAGLADDPLDDVQQVAGVVEDTFVLLEPAVPFHVNGLWAVDQDVADGRVVHQRFQRSQAEGLVEDLVDQAFAFGAAEQARAALAQLVGHAADFLRSCSLFMVPSADRSMPVTSR